MSEKQRKQLSSPESNRTRPNNAASTSHMSTRFTIEQKVANVKKGPANIKRSLDPKDVEIQRRFGEGSKPIFSREDIKVNSIRDKSTSPKRRPRQYSSSSESSSESSRSRSNSRRRHRLPSPKRKKTPEKIPYFTDPKREEDRLRRKYGALSTHRSRTRSRSKRKTRSRSISNHRSRRKRKTRSRSLSRKRTRNRSRSSSKRRRRSHSRPRSLDGSRRRNRSKSRERSRRRSPYPEQRYIPVAIPVEYPCPAGWMAPPIQPFPRNPYMIRHSLPQPVPYYPVRPPFMPMGYPRRPPMFPGKSFRPYRPGPR